MSATLVYFTIVLVIVLSIVGLALRFKRPLSKKHAFGFTLLVFFEAFVWVGVAVLLVWKLVLP